MWLTDQFARQLKSEFGYTETAPLVKAILTLWTVLLAPWLPLAALAGMAFDGGDTLAANIFVWSIWLYPVSVSAAFFCRQKRPALVLLPIVNIVVWFTSGS